MSSPLYNSNGHDEMYDTAFTADISNRMQVPKRIRVGGKSISIYDHVRILTVILYSTEGNNDEDTMVNGHYNSRYDYKMATKYEMNVPDRILVVGQDKHIGMKAPPQELVLENSILTMDYPPVRVRVFFSNYLKVAMNRINWLIFVDSSTFHHGRYDV